MLFGFVLAAPPPFGLDGAANRLENVRVAGPIVAAWLVVFCLPLFLWTPDPRGRGLAAGPAIRTGLAELVTTLRNLPNHSELWRYLLARMFFIDGLNTLFAFGGVFAAGTFGMSVAEVIGFGLVFNVTAGLGAFGFGWVDDRIGAKRPILIGLAGLVVAAVTAATGSQRWGMATVLPFLLIGAAMLAVWVREPGRRA